MKRYLIGSIIAGLIVVGSAVGSAVGSVRHAGNSHKLLPTDNTNFYGFNLLPSISSKKSYTHNEETYGIITNDATWSNPTPRTIFKIRVTCDGSISDRDADYNTWKTASIDDLKPTTLTENDTTLNLSDPSFKVSSKTICYYQDGCDVPTDPLPSIISYYIKVDNSTITGGSYCSIQMDTRDTLITIQNPDPDYSSYLTDYCLNLPIVNIKTDFIDTLKYIMERIHDSYINPNSIISCKDAVKFIFSDIGELSVSNYYLEWQIIYLKSLK